MKIFIICILIIVASNGFSQIPEVSYGTIHHINDFPSIYIDARNVDVWLPDGYNENKKYAVLYMHDGQMLFDVNITWNGQEWKVDETVSRLLDDEMIKDCIVVGIWNNGDYRRSEYLPQKALEYMPDHLAEKIIKERLMGKPRSDNYLKYLVNELKPYIDHTYSTYTDSGNTYIMGSSMGGLISLYAICEYPEIFGAAACMSTHWYGEPVDQSVGVPVAYVSYLQRKLPDPPHNRIYFDYGSETLDQYYKPYQMLVDVLMEERGYDSTFWMTKEFIGAAHTEDAWAERLINPLIFLLGKE